MEISSAQPDIVIHYAAINGTRYFYDIPYQVCNDNIIMTQNVLEACSEISSIRKIVYASSSEVYGPSPKIPTQETEEMKFLSKADRDSYASSKGIGEFLVRLWAKKNKKKYLILRPFNTYGPRMVTGGYGQVIPEFIERIKSDEDFYLYGDGKQTRSFCYVKDHTKLVIELIKNADNEIINIGYDEEITIEDLAKIIHEILGKNFSVKLKKAWPNDTKWRKPSLEKLFKYTNHRDYIVLKEGIKNMIRGD